MAPARLHAEFCSCSWPKAGSCGRVLWEEGAVGETFLGLPHAELGAVRSSDPRPPPVHIFLSCDTSQPLRPRPPPTLPRLSPPQRALFPSHQLSPSPSTYCLNRSGLSSLEGWPRAHGASVKLHGRSGCTPRSHAGADGGLWGSRGLGGILWVFSLSHSFCLVLHVPTVAA